MPRRTHPRHPDEEDTNIWSSKKCRDLLRELHQGTAEPEKPFYRDKQKERSCVYARKKQSHAIH